MAGEVPTVKKKQSKKNRVRSLKNALVEKFSSLVFV